MTRTTTRQAAPYATSEKGGLSLIARSETTGTGSGTGRDPVGIRWESDRSMLVFPPKAVLPLQVVCAAAVEYGPPRRDGQRRLATGTLPLSAPTDVRGLGHGWAGAAAGWGEVGAMWRTAQRGGQPLTLLS
jgi:hypothetical protein